MFAFGFLSMPRSPGAFDELLQLFVASSRWSPRLPLFCSTSLFNCSSVLGSTPIVQAGSQWRGGNKYSIGVMVARESASAAPTFYLEHGCPILSLVPAASSVMVHYRDNTDQLLSSCDLFEPPINGRRLHQL